MLQQRSPIQTSPLQFNKYIDLSSAALETNASQWEVIGEGDRSVLQIVNNENLDHHHGSTAIFPFRLHNYRMTAELRFLGHHLEDKNAGWFGMIVRAQNPKNYEMVWFMPNIPQREKAAYLPVAHGIIPWWTEAFASQEKGEVEVPVDGWFKVQLDVIGDEITLFVEGEKIFTKRMTYYLNTGKPGFYIGTGTDAAFRHITFQNF